MVGREPEVRLYDGSFPGLLCVLGEVMAGAEVPEKIRSQCTAELSIFDGPALATSDPFARKTEAELLAKLGPRCYRFIQHAFLTCLKDREVAIARFVLAALNHGGEIIDMIQHPLVYPLHRAVVHMRRESHLLKGFVRFSQRGGVLTAEITPKNCVLPLIADHFCQRFHNERFLIVDLTHGLALAAWQGQAELVSADGFTLPSADAGESEVEALWQTFFDAIAVPGRINSRLQRSMMPMRYWRHMTEFNR